MPVEPKTKHQQVITALRRPNGVTLDQLVKITGWKAASVRGCIATLKSKRGLNIASDKLDRVRRYRIAKAAP